MLWAWILLALLLLLLSNVVQHQDKLLYFGAALLGSTSHLQLDDTMNLLSQHHLDFPPVLLAPHLLQWVRNIKGKDMSECMLNFRIHVTRDRFEHAIGVEVRPGAARLCPRDVNYNNLESLLQNLGEGGNAFYTDLAHSMYTSDGVQADLLLSPQDRLIIWQEFLFIISRLKQGRHLSQIQANTMQALSSADYARLWGACEHVSALPTGRLLDQGGMGNVYRVKERGSGERLAIKSILLGTINSPRIIWKEIMAMKLLASQRNFFPQLRWTRMVGLDRVLLGMELLQGFNPEHGFYYGFRIDDSLYLRAVAKHLLQALKFMAENGLVHRDVKPGNLFFCLSGRLLLLDFGLVHFVNEHSSQLSGTPGYVPPEFYSTGSIKPQPSELVDVWALGITLLELARGQMFSDFDGDWSRHWGEIKTTLRQLRPILGEDGVDFIACCLEPQDKRSTLTALLQHPFVAQNNTINEAALYQWVTANARKYTTRHDSKRSPTT